MTPAALYDELQEMFGIGDWSEGSALPWYRARMNEIGKLKRMLKSRRVDVDDVHLAALYAREQQIPVTAAWRLFELIPEARKAAVTRAVPERLERALAEAIAAGDTHWAMRLDSVHRNDTSAVTAVLKEYDER